MYLKLLKLELTNFLRHPQFTTNLFSKLMMGFSAFSILIFFLMSPVMVFFIAKVEFSINPIELLSKYFTYYLLGDLVFRYIVQNLSSQNIKPLLTLNISKETVVKYSLLKFSLHFINLGCLFFLIIFGGLLCMDFEVWRVLCYVLGLFLCVMSNSFLNIILNKKSFVFYAIGFSLALLVFLEYRGVITLTNYSLSILSSFYESPITILYPLILVVFLVFYSFKMLKADFYLDKGLKVKMTEAKTENIDFLNRFGVVGMFINNDIRLIKRNKFPRKVFFTGIGFIFYGLVILLDSYNNVYTKMLIGLIVTGSFVMNFGGRVPAWDSQFYPLMMTMNVPYKEYLNAKWYSMFIMTAVSTLLAIPYAIFGWEYYGIIFCAGIFNLGVNVHLTLLQGSYNKEPIDLNGKTKQVNKTSFTILGLVLGFGKIILPIALFSLMNYFVGIMPALLSVAVFGIIGFFTKDIVLDKIVSRYKTEKYTTLESFKKGY